MILTDGAEMIDDFEWNGHGAPAGHWYAINTRMCELAYPELYREARAWSRMGVMSYRWIE